MFSIPFIFLFVVFVIAQDWGLSTVKRAFDDANIPETINLSFNPKVLLEVTFPEPCGEPITLHAGVQLTINATAGPPAFSIVGNTRCVGSFVVVLVDPDALTPEDPSISQIRHFVRPRPFVGLDAHRYIFLLFKQPKGFNDQTLFNPSSPRAYFNISSFAAAVGLGQPIGGTYMLVGPDPSTA